MIFYER